MSKMNWKKVIGWGVAALVVIGVVGTNMYNQQKNSTGKRNVYAVLPLTGPLSVWGKQAKETIDYYLKTHVHDKLNLIYIDSESNPSKALTGLQSKVLDENNPIVISAISSVSASLLPFLDKNRGFNVSMYAKDSPTYVHYKNQQRISFPVKTEIGEKVMNYINKNYKTMTVLYSEDELGRLGLQKLKEMFKGEIIDSFSFSVAERDVRNTVVKALATKPEAFFAIAPASLGLRNVLKELGTSGFEGGIFANQAYQVDSVYKNLEGIDNVFFPCYDILVEDPVSPKRAQVVSELAKEGLELSCLTIEPYNSIAFVNYLIENNIPFNREDILKLKTFEGIAGPLNLTENGDAEVDLGLCKTKNGKIVPVTE